MRRVFADTSALVALRDGKDRRHDEALDWLRKGLEDKSLRLVVTQYVLAEVHAFFCRTPGPALDYVEKLRTEAPFQTVRVEKEDEARAWDILRRHADKAWSFVDACSFALMARAGIDTAFAFDDHFRQAGRFKVVP